MKIIVTAGGTRERIDMVRFITNLATGSLGSMIADALLPAMPETGGKLYYICGPDARVPQIDSPALEILTIEGTDELQQQIDQLLATERIDAVIHSMAVSDYKVATITSTDQLASTLSLTPTNGIDSLTDSLLKLPTKASGKMSSEIEHPVLILEKTPKVIASIKRQSPETILVGFKLLSGVTQEELIDTGYQLLLKNKCDYVLANDTDTVYHGNHTGYLISPDHTYETYLGKHAIALGIANAVLSRI